MLPETKVRPCPSNSPTRSSSCSAPPRSAKIAASPLRRVLKGAAAQKTATKLVAAGLAKEMKAKPGAHVWRRDDATGLAYALKVTPADGDALEDAEAAEPAVQISPPATGEVRTNIVDHEASTENVAGSTMIAKPREGSKLAGVIDLLRHEDGATIDQLADPSPAGAIESPSPSRSPRGAAQSWRRSPNCFSGTMARQSTS